MFSTFQGTFRKLVASEHSVGRLFRNWGPFCVSSWGSLEILVHVHTLNGGIAGWRVREMPIAQRRIDLRTLTIAYESSANVKPPARTKGHCKVLNSVLTVLNSCTCSLSMTSRQQVRHHWRNNGSDNLNPPKKTAKFKVRQRHSSCTAASYSGLAFPARLSVPIPTQVSTTTPSARLPRLATPRRQTILSLRHPALRLAVAETAAMHSTSGAGWQP